jgi:signal transduction histidine kinase
MRPVVATSTAFVVAAAVSALAWSLPGFDLAYGSEGMHIALEAIAGSVSLLVGAVAWARFTRSRRLADFLVAAAFGVVLSVGEILLLALPTLLNFELPRSFSEWATLGTAVLGSLLVAVAAWLPVRVSLGSRAAGGLAALVVLGVSALATACLLLEPRLPLVVQPGLSPLDAGPLVGNPWAAAADLAAAALLLLAAWRFAVGSVLQELQGWVAPALAVDAVAHVDDALFPSAFSFWIYSADLLRLGAYVLLAWGIVAELRAATRRAIETAVLEERRRVARDLHDGLAQELAFVAGELLDIPPATHPSLPWIRSAVERALYESRRAIEALTLPADEPLAAAVAAEVAEIAGRAGVAIRLDLDHSLEVDLAVREAILRVAREAVTNAVRHGQATVVRVSLHRDRSRTRLAVADDGAGLGDPGTGRGFGLTSMRERVAASNGELRLASPAGAGTTVEAHWP